MNRMTAGAAALAAAALAGVVGAHSGATGKVADRMTAMKDMGEAVKSVTPMMRGEAAYDAATMRAAAQTIAGRAGAALTAHFPEGSLHGPSEALPAIWQDWARFSGLARRLKAAARGLERAASNPPAAGGGTGAGAGMGAMMGQRDTGSMMGGDAMMGGGAGMGDGAGMDADRIAQMPADMAFAATTRVCAACHDDFRAEDD